MQAITRGWVVQVTPVHERSSPRAARFCFEFYTVTRGGEPGVVVGGGGVMANEQLGPACAWPWGSSTAWQAAGGTRCRVGSSRLWRIAGRASHGVGRQAGFFFWGGARERWAFAACVSAARSCYRERQARGSVVSALS